MENTLRIFKDDVAERLDEVALIAAAYKANRDAGRPTNILRCALLDAAEDALAVSQGAPGRAARGESLANE